MSAVIFTVVLGAAFLHAVWNALIKTSGDRLVIMAVTTGSASLLVLPFLFLFPFPAPTSWPYLALSVVVHCIYMLFLVRAYAHGEFAQIYSLARGSAPLLTAILGFLILGERLQQLEISGMLLIVFGIVLLSLERNRGIRRLSTQALSYSLLTGFFISAYSLIDGMGARLAGSSHSYTVWLFFLDGFLVPLVAIRRRPRAQLRKSLRQVWKSGVLVACLSTPGYWLIIWAFTQERIAMVAVLRETSVLFAVLISLLFIRERLSLQTVAYILVIVTGVVLLGI